MGAYIICRWLTKEFGTIVTYIHNIFARIPKSNMKVDLFFLGFFCFLFCNSLRIHQIMQQNILHLSTGNSKIQQSKVQFQTSQWTHILCSHKNCLLLFAFESPASLLNKIEALDEGSVRLKNKIGVSFGKLSLCFVPSAWEEGCNTM